MKNSKFIIPVLLAAFTLGMQSCKKKEMEEEPVTPTTPMMSATYNYEFNNGQVVASAAYDGMHMDNFSVQMMVQELSSTQSKITVTLMNTVSGQTYNIHAHDAADPATTPNGTPYNESPNTNVFVQQAMGNGGNVSVSQTVNMTYAQITSTYDGFLVVHDPLQMMSTTDISTYLVVGTFARTQTASGLASSMFNYDFNTGQVDPSFAYAGTHANTLSGMLKVQALADGTSRVSVMLMNTMNGEMYMIHAHDAADPATTPNGTPYDETPNSNLCTVMVNGNGGTAGASQISTMSYTDITTTYSGFFVVHDPLQAVSTTDPTTYVLLGLFAN